MAKKRKRRSSAAKKSSFAPRGMKGIFTNAALVLGGIVAGSVVANKLQKKDVSGEDLLGLDGDASKLATPAILMALGVAGMTMVKNKLANTVASGVLLAGGAKAVNALAGKSVVALGDADEQDEQVMIPGVGEVMIPGVGGEERVTYDDLPDNNEMLTSYHEEVGDVDTVYVDEDGQPIEGADDEEDLLGFDGDDEEELL